MLDKVQRWRSEVRVFPFGFSTDQVTVLQSIPLDSQKLPLSIVNYVLRTEKVVVLNDATGEGQFMRDDYIITQQPQSILCAPLLNQGRLTASVSGFRR